MSTSQKLQQTVESLIKSAGHLLASPHYLPEARHALFEAGPAAVNENEDPQLSQHLMQGKSEGAPVGYIGCASSRKAKSAVEGAGAGGVGEDTTWVAGAALSEVGGCVVIGNPQTGAGGSIDPEMLVGGRRALEGERDGEEASKRARKGRNSSPGNGALLRRSAPDVGMALEGGGGRPMVVKAIDPRGSVARSSCGVAHLPSIPVTRLSTLYSFSRPAMSSNTFVSSPHPHSSFALLPSAAPLPPLL